MSNNFIKEDTLEAEMLLAAAKKIGKIAAQEAYEADRNGTFSKKVIDAIVEGNINKLLIPKRHGGLEVDLRTYTEVIRTVAKYSPAAAWLTFLYATHNVWVSYLPPKGREEIFKHGGLIADVLAPVGSVEEDGENYRLTGHWNFASGILYSDWVGLGALIQFPDSETPEFCMLAVPTSDVEIVKNWDTFGLRATGSNGVKVNRALVPKDRIVRISRAAVSGPLDADYDKDELVYQVPLLTLFYIGFPMIALGGAESLLEEFKKRTERRIRVYELGVLEKESARSQRVLAELKTHLAAAEGLMDKYISLLEEYQHLDKEHRTNEGYEQFFALRSQTIKICAELAVKVLLTLGGTAIFKGDPVELFVRDLMIVATHPTSLYEDALSAYGQTLFGSSPFFPKF